MSVARGEEDEGWLNDVYLGSQIRGGDSPVFALCVVEVGMVLKTGFGSKLGAGWFRGTLPSP